jgi:hypothetical protein
VLQSERATLALARGEWDGVWRVYDFRKRCIEKVIGLELWTLASRPCERLNATETRSPRQERSTFCFDDADLVAPEGYYIDDHLWSTMPDCLP